jgi:hypothetical protein
LTKGDHGGEHLAQLTSINESGEAAVVIQDVMLEGRVNITTYTAMKESIKIIMTNGHTLTENVCRAWCQQVGDSMVTDIIADMAAASFWYGSELDA